MVEEMPILLGVAGLLAFWPYHRNLVLFGSLISDNPASICTKEIELGGVFLPGSRAGVMARKNSSTALLQGLVCTGGILLSFWFMTLGVIFYCDGGIARLVGNASFTESTSNIYDRVMLTASCRGSDYLCGTLHFRWSWGLT